MKSESMSEDRWKRFCKTIALAAIFSGLFVYGFVVFVDPWDILPLSPKFDRAPVSTSARYSFPALARKQRFDSLILGTSTSRLLRPENLDAAFSTSFVNLAMNSATAYEQMKLLDLFVRYHSDIKILILGVDRVWCGVGQSYEKQTTREIPEWMYSENLYPAYKNMLTLYAIEESWKQFKIITGITNKSRHGRNGYANFLPDDSVYDLEKIRNKLERQTIISPKQSISVDRKNLNFPTHALLEHGLANLPLQTIRILFFVPYHFGILPALGGYAEEILEECKERITRIADRSPGTTVVDFMIASPLTIEDAHYWDPLHYRVFIADRLMADLVEAANGQASADGHYRFLTGR